MSLRTTNQAQKVYMLTTIEKRIPPDLHRIAARKRMSPEAVVREVIEGSATLGEAAQKLNVTRHTLLRWRERTGVA